MNDRYASGLDELWDTLLRQLANQCANYYEGQGYELRKTHISESLERAVGDVLGVEGVPSDLADALATAARGYFGSSVKSLTQILDESALEMEPTALLRFAAELAALSGYQILLGVDELEKSDRSQDHFRSIEAFVEEMPQGISLFVTGTPELVVGGEAGNAMKATYQPLFERTRQNRIVLDSPSEQELVEFAERMMVVERVALGDSFSATYTEAIEAHGGAQAAVTTFLNDRRTSFRAFLAFLEA